MLLVIDIGNTSIKFGLFDKDKLVSNWKIPTSRNNNIEQVKSLLPQNLDKNKVDFGAITVVIVSSVVPPLDLVVQSFSQRLLNLDPIFVRHTFDFGFEIDYAQPENLGVDRLVAAFAAREKYGKPIIVCDFGTATTMDAVNSQNVYLGGIIVTGMSVLAEALNQKTAKLPPVEIEKVESVFGKSTIGAIQSGIYFGYTSLVDGIIRRMIEELNEKPKVVATGGLAPLIAGGAEMIDMVDENLMLEGLRLIYERNIKN